jgi:flavorubredoxin
MLIMQDETRTWAAAKRYFAEIMMPFRDHIQKHMQRLAALDIAVVAPSHGVVYARPAFIFDAYRSWVSAAVANRVLLPFVSMHGSTRLLVDRLTDALTARKVEVVPCNLVHADPGRLAEELVDCATVVFASPMVLAGPHPLAAEAAFLVNALRPKTRFAALLGSYGWGGKLAETLKGMLANLKVEWLPDVIVKGLPTEADLAAIDLLADTIAARHAGL